MTDQVRVGSLAVGPAARRKLRLPPWTTNLSARLLALAMAFVMVSEVLIFAPSAGRFRVSYLRNRLEDGNLAVLALEAAPDQAVSEALERELLGQAQAYLIALRRPDGVKLMLGQDTAPMADASYDIDDRRLLPAVGAAFSTLLQSHNRVLRVTGASPRRPGATIEVLIDEAPMRTALIEFSGRVLGLSVAISLITAALLFFSLQWIVVRPVRRLTESMVAFRDDPENAAALLPATRRRDEIGIAQRELIDMEEKLRAALHQKTRLAALGSAMTKVNHDLRNILGTARLVSDRLAGSGDPEVQRATPMLLRAIDRAADLCSAILQYSREGPPRLERTRFRLARLIEEVGTFLPLPPDSGFVLDNRVDESLELVADRDQLFRVLSNLVANAAEAKAGRVEIVAGMAVGRLHVTVKDDGPGLPAKARERLFQPFAGSARPGGSGLGLAIARDLVRAHGGELRLERTGPQGTVFEIELPEAPG
jgi:signal transduction histidine kinase